MTGAACPIGEDANIGTSEGAKIPTDPWKALWKGFSLDRKKRRRILKRAVPDFRSRGSFSRKTERALVLGGAILSLLTSGPQAFSVFLFRGKEGALQEVD